MRTIKAGFTLFKVWIIKKDIMKEKKRVFALNADLIITQMVCCAKRAKPKKL